jgi:predicted ATPase
MRFPKFRGAHYIESQNRLQPAFRQVARKEHPLVIFLDDLQWADSASLQLLEIMMTDSQIDYLFNMGRYVDAITLGLDSLQEYEIRIPRYPGKEIVLQEREAVHKLISRDTHRLLELPEVTDPDLLAAMNLMLALILPTMVSDKDVYTLLISTYMKHSLKHGNCRCSLFKI